MHFFPKPLRIFLRIVLIVSTVIWPGMCFLTAAGWQTQVDAGNYPEQFAVHAFWMYTGAGLLVLGTVLCMLGIRRQLWGCNLPAIGCAAVGLAAVRIVLERFTVYADQNFSITDEGRTVSTIFRERLLPVWLPAVLIVVLSLWQLLGEPAREYRIRRHAEKRRKLEAPAPKIVEDE